jgi:hypothetical protein
LLNDNKDGGEQESHRKYAKEEYGLQERMIRAIANLGGSLILLHI